MKLVAIFSGLRKRSGSAAKRPSTSAGATEIPAANEASSASSSRASRRRAKRSRHSGVSSSFSEAPSAARAASTSTSAIIRARHASRSSPSTRRRIDCGSRPILTSRASQTPDGSPAASSSARLSTSASLEPRGLDPGASCPSRSALEVSSPYASGAAMSPHRAPAENTNRNQLERSFIDADSLTVEAARHR